MTPERDPFELVENLWRSVANQPADQLNAQRDALARRLRRDRWRFVAGISLAAGLLLAMTVALALGVPLDRRGPSQVVLLALLAAPWLGFTLFLRGYLRHRREHPHPERSLADSLRALLDQNRRAQARVRTMAGLHLASLPVLGLAIRQLEAGGKVAASEVGSLVAVFAVLLVATGVGLAYRYFADLRPRERSLRSVLAGYP